MYGESFASGTSPHVFHGVYDTFEQALAMAPPSAPVGYDNDEAASLYRARPIYPEDYAVLFWLRSLAGTSTHLFDYGGHAGGMFDAFKPLLSLPAGFEWTIYDVPAVVAAGRALNESRSDPKPRFTSDWHDASQADILLASGSLQYLKPSAAALLAELGRLPRHLVINQQPLHDRLEYFTLQRIGGIFCPYRISRRDRFFESLESLGYRVVDSWENAGKSCYVPTYPSHGVTAYTGAYLLRNA
jgi:putative methyltransferase (TIGR04325 family)